MAAITKRIVQRNPVWERISLVLMAGRNIRYDCWRQEPHAWATDIRDLDAAIKAAVVLGARRVAVFGYQYFVDGKGNYFDAGFSRVTTWGTKKVTMEVDGKTVKVTPCTDSEYLSVSERGMFYITWDYEGAMP